MSNYGASVVTHCHTIFVPPCLNPLCVRSPCGRGSSSPQLADRRQRLKFGLEEGLLMKSRITNQSPLLALVIRVRTAQRCCCGEGWAWFWDSGSNPRRRSSIPLPSARRVSSHRFPYSLWPSPPSTAGSSHVLLVLQYSSAISHIGQAATPRPPAAFAAQRNAGRSPNSCSPRGGQLSPFGWGRKPISLGVPLPWWGRVRFRASCALWGQDLQPWPTSCLWGCSRLWERLQNQHSAETKMSNISEVGSEAWCLWHPWVGRKSSFHLISLLRGLLQCEMYLIGLSGELRKSLFEV